MLPQVELLAYQPAVCHDSSTTVQLLIRLHAPKPTHSRRPPLNLGLSIDRSGSMNGLPLQRALEAGSHVVRNLEPADLISVVAFDSSVEVLTPCPSRQALLDKMMSLTARGGTDLHAGWSETCRQVSEGIGQGRLTRVLLLSDGGANEGVTDPQRIAQDVANWQSRGVTTTTIGLGAGYNEDLMAAMARAGNGSFYHVQTPEDIVSTFQIELLGMCATFGQGVSLGIEPAPGVELIRVVNPLEQTARGRYKLADLVHGCPLEVVIELHVPPQTRERDLCNFRLAWTPVEGGRRQVVETALFLPVVANGQLSEFPLNPEVAQKRVLKLSARFMGEAIGLLDRNDRAGARTALQAGLDLVKEAAPSPELQQTALQLQRLLAQLDSGDLGGARKHATFASSSMSMGSISMNRGVREFMNLPPDQRTPEKFAELLGGL